MHIATAGRATAEQLITLTTGEGLKAKDNWHAEGVLRQYAPGTMASFEASRQQQDAFNFQPINLLQVPLALLTMALLPVLIVLLRHRRPDLSMLAITVLFALIANAAICAIFSNPNARYQSRIAPLATLVVVMALLDRWKQARALPQPAPPAAAGSGARCRGR